MKGKGMVTQREQWVVLAQDSRNRLAVFGHFGDEKSAKAWAAAQDELFASLDFTAVELFQKGQVREVAESAYKMESDLQASIRGMRR